ncbi:MAG: hypothetical protein EBR82_24175 [Caulobacteraceae bacterium]|nr:hypothetical protein [Caulobacteraceae bacterium]
MQLLFLMILEFLNLLMFVHLVQHKEIHLVDINILRLLKFDLMLVELEHKELQIVLLFLIRHHRLKMTYYFSSFFKFFSNTTWVL